MPITERRSDAEVYADLAPELARFAAGLVGPSDAADVLSNAVLAALSSPQWKNVTNHRAYLYRAVYTAARAWNRRSNQRLEREARASSQSYYELPGFHPEVARAVSRLSTQQRAVIVLTYWADLQPRAIASHLGVSEGSVKRHLARARRHLREVLHADT